MAYYNLSVCAGTFDAFHAGHQAFLRFALSKSAHLLLGITSEKYVATYKPNQSIESYQIRKKNVESFLEQEHALAKVTIQPIDDVYGPVAWQKMPIEAIIVSQDSQKGAEIVNERRIRQGEKPLIVEIVPFVTTSSGDILSSTKIREGVVDKQGDPYLDPRWKTETLFLPEKLRETLKKPYGTLYKTIAEWKKTVFIENTMLVTVGDIVTREVNKEKIPHPLSVVDLHTRRSDMLHFADLGFEEPFRKIHLVNPAGTLRPEIFSTLATLTQQATDEQIVLCIGGEEDLLVLPLIITLPLGYTILYGQPDEGVVAISVTEKSKKDTVELLRQFTK